jgi:hypothetical protein
MISLKKSRFFIQKRLFNLKNALPGSHLGLPLQSLALKTP